MKLLTDIFHRQTADQIRREQLEEAERLQVQHQAAAELHACMAGIYRVRTERLRGELTSPAVATLRAAT